MKPALKDPERGKTGRAEADEDPRTSDGGINETSGETCLMEDPEERDTKGQEKLVKETLKRRKKQSIIQALIGAVCVIVLVLVFC